MSEKMINRRDFMKTSMAGFGGFVFLASNGKKQEEKIVETKGTERKFVYRTLGKTGLKLPVISMGAMYAIDPALIRAALDSGIVHFETAHVHMAGKGEIMLGEVIKGRPRDSLLITTKLAFPADKIKNIYGPAVTEETFMKYLEISLKRLGLDYLDFLFLHGAVSRETALFEPILNAMEKSKKQGKIRFAGVSTHRNEVEVTQAAIDSKIYDVIMLPYHFKQRNYLEFRDAIAKAAQSGLGVVAMKTMGGTGSISDILKPVNASASLKWVLQDPCVHTAVPGFTNFEQLNTDLSVMEDLSLTDSDKEYLKTASATPGLYCQGCGQCERQCFAKLPIPDLMRAYMYAYGYRNLRLAQDLVVSLNLSRRLCEDCGKCPVKCSIGFNVSAKIRDVARVRDIPMEFIV